MTWAHAAKPWPGEPEECTCTQMVVATLEETLDCPRGFLWIPGTGFAHAPRWWRSLADIPDPAVTP